MMVWSRMQEAGPAQPEVGQSVPGTEPPEPTPSTPTAGSSEPPITAQPDAPKKPFSPTEGLVAVGLLIAAVMILGLVILAMRKRLFRDDSRDTVASGLLDDLRRALHEGRMTQEEFDAAKRTMVARFTGKRRTEKSDEGGL